MSYDALLRINIKHALRKAEIPFTIDEPTENLQEKLAKVELEKLSEKDLLGEFEAWATASGVAATPNIMLAFTAGFLLGVKHGRKNIG